jgi:hypothetical protein
MLQKSSPTNRNSPSKTKFPHSKNDNRLQDNEGIRKRVLSQTDQWLKGREDGAVVRSRNSFKRIWSKEKFWNNCTFWNEKGRKIDGRNPIVTRFVSELFRTRKWVVVWSVNNKMILLCDSLWVVSFCWKLDGGLYTVNCSF